MPRKVVVPSRKRPLAASGAERRSKAQNEPVRSPPPVFSPPRSIPSRSCAGRVVSTGRKVDFDFLSHEGFTLGHRLRVQGLEYFCSLDLPTYPGLVRKFYGTVTRGGGGIQRRVANIPICISENLIARVLHLSREGIAPTHPTNRSEALTAILGRVPNRPLRRFLQISSPLKCASSLVSSLAPSFPKSVDLISFQKKT